MSIPSIPPPNSAQGPQGPAYPEPPNNETGGSTSAIDPTGSWQKFLSMSGTPATKQDVEKFFQTLLKTFTTLIQQQAAAHKRAMDEAKKAFTGDE